MNLHSKFYLIIKRVIGIFGSIFGIALCVVLLWWWVLPVNIIATKGHPFFVQKRLGKHKKIFGLIKFRSMKVNANPNLAPSDMTKETQDSMDTWFGPFLRKSSIDETLQLFNIFVGQMAFIGPRPGAAVNEEFLIECREKYSPNAYDVRPGLGGLAQLKMGRDHDPEKKAEYDHFYAKNICFKFDAEIFIWTVLGLFGKVRGR